MGLRRAVTAQRARVRASAGECGRVRASAGGWRGGGVRAAGTHYSNNMHAVKLASKTRFSFICAQFHMNHDYFV